MAPIEQSEYVTLTQLEEKYHFTPSWIARLGEPDLTKPNPNYRTGPPMRLYRRERVAQVIADNREEYDRRLATHHRQSQRAQPAVERRRVEREATITARLAEAEAALVIVYRRSLETVRRDAIAAYNKRARLESLEGDYDREECDEGSNPALLDRIVVNDIRHCLSNYDQLMERITAGREDDRATSTIGKRLSIEIADLAASMIRSRIYDKIAEVYPMLAEACVQQRAYRQMQEDLAREWNRRSSRG